MSPAESMIPLGHRLPPSESMRANVIEVEGRTYEQRFNRCGRKECARCNGSEVLAGARPGHGPYWYLTETTERGTRRMYIGKELDTRMWIREDGKPDWKAYREAKRNSKRERAEARARRQAEVALSGAAGVSKSSP